MPIIKFGKVVKKREENVCVCIHMCVCVLLSTAAAEIYSSSVVDRRMRCCQSVCLSICQFNRRSVDCSLGFAAENWSAHSQTPHIHAHATANNKHCVAPLSTPHAPLTNITNTPRLLQWRCTSFGCHFSVLVFVFRFSFLLLLHTLRLNEICCDCTQQSVFLILYFFQLFFTTFSVQQARWHALPPKCMQR